MNQDNNFNQNNFNTQGNNGIPNNQSLNNQGFNQNININQQTTSSFQQSIMQEPIPQPTNTFAGSSANNQSINSKPPKKMNLGLIIGIVVFVVTLTVTVFFIFKKDSTIGEEKNYTMYTKIYETDDNKFYYANDNEKIKTFSGFESMGNTFHYNVTQGSDSNNDYFLIDINNNYIVKPGVYEKIVRLGNKFFSTYKNKKYGVIDYNGNEILSPQYTNIKYIIDDEIGYFLAEYNKNNEIKEYYLINEDGKTIITSDKNINKQDVKIYKKFTDKTIDTLLYNNNVYDLNSGKLLLKNLGAGQFKYNVFLSYDDNKIIIYDKEFKEKEKISAYNLLGIEKMDDGLLIKTNIQYFLDKNLEITKYEEYKQKKLDEQIKKDGFSKIEEGFYHILANKTKVITKIDKENDRIVIYDETGKYLAEHKVADGERWKNVYTIGNYLVIEGRMGTIAVFDVNGNTIIGLAQTSYMDDIYNGKENYIATTHYANKTTIFNDNFILDFNDKISNYYLENGVWVLNKNTASFYDMNGKIIETMDNISKIWELEDNYFMFEFYDKSYKIIDSQNNITLEFDGEISYSGIPYSYKDNEIGIIELSDGFYALGGTKLITK